MTEDEKAQRPRPRGMEKVRTMKSQGGRSVPRSQSNGYLDLYVLHKEKERLDQELAMILKRGETTANRLEEVRARIEALEKANNNRGHEKISEAAPSRPPRKDWKVMSVNY